MAKELELKLDLGEQGKEELKSNLEGLLLKLGVQPVWQERALINHYYDTSEFNLNKKRVALRIRELGNRFIQTFKTKGKTVNGVSERGEWEWFVESPELNERQLYELPEWPSDIDINVLKVVFETNFVRLQSDILFDDASMELALDIGQVSSQSKVAPINELELELKAGDVSSLIKLGKIIEKELNAKPSDVSKAERGYRLYKA